MRYFSFSRLLSLAVIMAVVGCSQGPSLTDVDENRTPDELLAEAVQLSSDQKLSQANEVLRALSETYPNSDQGARALILSAFVQLKKGDYAEAAVSAQRYLSYYPASRDADYALYMLGKAYLGDGLAIQWDQSGAQRAHQVFTELNRRFPESSYGPEAMASANQAFDQLAAKEVDIGRYYLRRDHYHAAIGRFRKVLNTYAGTAHEAEALYRLMEVYIALDLPLAVTSLTEELTAKFPDDFWTASGYDLLAKHGIERP